MTNTTTRPQRGPGSSKSYHTDFYAWTQEQVALLDAEEWEKLDTPHIKEEIESMGISQRSGLTSRLKVLLMHLLKWRYQPERNYGNSWRDTIEDQRFEIEILLRASPSLRREVPEEIAYVYPKARKKAVLETELALTTFQLNVRGR